MAIQNISESVYVGMCLKIGTPQQVATRRDIVNIAEMFKNTKMLNVSTTVMQSGSSREGFRLSGSDRDFMRWPSNYRVIWDLSQLQFYNTQEYTLILCDSSGSPPGFTLLWLPLERTKRRVLSFCVRMNGGLYISSSKYREATLFMISSDATMHGPCSNRLVDSQLEYDDAHYFLSDFWPLAASLWIE